MTRAGNLTAAQFRQRRETRPSLPSDVPPSGLRVTLGENTLVHLHSVIAYLAEFSCGFAQNVNGLLKARSDQFIPQHVWVKIPVARKVSRFFGVVLNEHDFHLLQNLDQAKQPNCDLAGWNIERTDSSVGSSQFGNKPRPDIAQFPKCTSIDASLKLLAQSEILRAKRHEQLKLSVFLLNFVNARALFSLAVTALCQLKCTHDCGYRANCLNPRGPVCGLHSVPMVDTEVFSDDLVEGYRTDYRQENKNKSLKELHSASLMKKEILA